MRTSYDICLDDLAAHGLGPRALPRGRPYSFRTEHFAKSHAEGSNGFDAVLDELHAMMNGNERRRRDSATASDVGDHGLTAKDLCDIARPNPSFAKALRTIGHEADQMLKEHRHREARRSAEVVTKAFTMLRHDPTLTPEQRGTLMLKLGELTDRVAGFAKSHPHLMISKIDRAQAALDRALCAGHAGHAEEIIAHANELLESGNLAEEDHRRVSVLLAEAKRNLKEMDNAKEK